MYIVNSTPVILTLKKFLTLSMFVKVNIIFYLNFYIVIPLWD
jgi:hypothetical protein